MLRSPDIVDLDRKKQFAGNLLICPTPIGNLGDLTLRNYQALVEADIIVCEDTRNTGKLLKLIQERRIGSQIMEYQEGAPASGGPEWEDDQRDDEFFEDFEKRELQRHPNMKSLKKLKEKARDQKYLDDVQDFRKKGERIQQKLDHLGFLKSSDQVERKFASGEVAELDDAHVIFSDSQSNKSFARQFAPESEFFDGLPSDKSKAQPSYGLHSEFIEFSKEKVLESKARKGRGVLLSCHRFNERERVQQIIRLLRAGLTVVVTSDAGSPSLSDPGQLLINEVMNSHLTVESLPGASAVTTSLAASGFPADEFIFIGYVDKMKTDKQRQLRRAKHLKVTAVIFENKHRLLVTLMNLAQIFGERQIVYVGVELTKLHQRQVRGELGECIDLLNRHPDFSVPSIKGEITIVVAPFAPEFNADAREEGVRETALSQNLGFDFLEGNHSSKGVDDFIELDQHTKAKKRENALRERRNKSEERGTKTEKVEEILRRPRTLSLMEVVKVLDEELEAPPTDLARILSRLTGDSRRDSLDAVVHFKKNF